jgi:hypothetical protein
LTIAADHISTLDIWTAVARTGLSFRTVLRRLRRFVIAGLRLAPGLPFSDPSARPAGGTDADLPMIQAIKQAEPSLHWQTDLAPDTWALILLVKCSLVMGKPMSDAYELCQRYYLLPIGTTIGRSALVRRTCDVDDLVLLSVDGDGVAPWVMGKISLIHVFVSAGRLNLSVAEVAARLSEFDGFGYTLPDENHLRAADGLDAEAKQLMNELTEERPRVERVTVRDVIQMAKHRLQPIADVYRSLADLAELFDFAMPDLDLSVSYVPGDTDMDLVRNDMYSRAIGHRNDTNLANIVRVARAIAPADNRKREEISRFVSLAHAELLTLTGVLKVAAVNNMTIEGVLRILKTVCNEQSTRAMEDIITRSVAVSDLRPRYDDMATLSWDGEWRPRVHHVQVSRLARTGPSDVAGLTEVVQRLDRFRPFGANPPSLSEQAKERLSRLRPTPMDLAAMSGEFGTRVHWQGSVQDIIDPLHLLLTAGRLGVTPAALYERLERYRPLGLAMTLVGGECPDDVVRWQDPILLTAGLDGNAPALAGPVSAEHIRRAAAECECEEGWVRARLHHYAPMFGLDVPEA